MSEIVRMMLTSLKTIFTKPLDTKYRGLSGINLAARMSTRPSIRREDSYQMRHSCKSGATPWTNVGIFHDHIDDPT